MDSKVSPAGEKDDRLLVKAIVVDVAFFVPAETVRVPRGLCIICQEDTTFQGQVIDGQSFEGTTNHLNVFRVGNVEVNNSFFVFRVVSHRD